MIVDVESKDIDTTNFVYLQAAQTTQQVIDEYDYENVEARHKIRIEVKRDFIFKGDKLLYSAVVSNFIKNALRSFNLKPSATLTITIDQPTITVRDTGPGATHRLPILSKPAMRKTTRNLNWLTVNRLCKLLAVT